MRATIDNSPQSSGEIIQLVVGWTVVLVAALLFIFNALIAIPVLFVGGCILGPSYSSRISIETIEEASISRRRPKEVRVSSSERLENALLYKELFREEIISQEEYEDTVGRLFPELERGEMGRKQNVAQHE